MDAVGGRRGIRGSGRFVPGWSGRAARTPLRPAPYLSGWSVGGSERVGRFGRSGDLRQWHHAGL